MAMIAESEQQLWRELLWVDAAAVSFQVKRVHENVTVATRGSSFVVREGNGRDARLC